MNLLDETNVNRLSGRTISRCIDVKERTKHVFKLYTQFSDSLTISVN